MKVDKTKWEKVRLGDVCKTSSGGTPLKKHSSYYDNGSIPWLRSGEVCHKDIKQTELFITKLGMEMSSAKLFPANTVVIAMYGATAGQVGILRIPATTNQAICGIYPNKECFPDFLYYALSTKYYDITKQAKGTAQPNISQNIIKNITLSLPSFPEQQAIAAELDAIQSVIDKLQEQLRDYDTLAQSIFNEILKRNRWKP